MPGAAAIIGGGLAWRRADEVRKGEEARRQVFTALRITNRALNEVNAQLSAIAVPIRVRRPK